MTLNVAIDRCEIRHRHGLKRGKSGLLLAVIVKIRTTIAEGVNEIIGVGAVEQTLRR